MTTLYFTRLFIRGNLNGLTHTDKISFPSVARCVQWKDAINKNASLGRLDYRIVDSSFQNYQR
ncbi:MAG: hypothetical protein DMF62_11760 [Acidobacteria bacterium]|nr:MAG: hypothetical protein DMF62_11760 [Acidobacteriota bacterium]